jgi:hypothetical protein
MKTKFIALGALVLASAAPAAAVTGSAAWDFTAPGTIFSNGDWSFGAAFTVNTAVKAVGLGIYSGPQTPVGNLVNLYECANLTCTTTGTLIATATVTATDTVIGNFTFAGIDPVSLATNTGYLVVGVMPFNYSYTWNTTGFATDSRVNYALGSDRYVPDLAAAFDPTIEGAVTNGWWGPNVLLSNVPEPSSWAMLIAGFGLTGAAMRRRRSTAVAA